MFYLDFGPDLLNGKLAQEYNSKTMAMGVEISAVIYWQCAN